MQDAVIEHQIWIVVFIVDDDATLSGLETEALAKFQKEILKVGDKSIFQVTFCQYILRFEPQELESEWLADGKSRRSCLWFDGGQ